MFFSTKAAQVCVRITEKRLKHLQSLVLGGIIEVFSIFLLRSLDTTDNLYRR
jgi:hypothetical protein